MAELKKVSGNLSITPGVLEEVANERKRQAALGYGTDHDDEYGVEHLVIEIERRAKTSNRLTDAQARVRLLHAAALSVAAIETIDRRADLIGNQDRMDINDLDARRRAR